MDQDSIKVLCLIVGFLLIAIYVAYSNAQKNKKKLNERLINSWGKPAKKTLSQDDYEILKHYFEDNYKDDPARIDDITWNDLNMDKIFSIMNHTNSSVGQEYLYKTLRMPNMDSDKLKEIDRLATFFDHDQKNRIAIQKLFVRLGYAKYISLSDYIALIMELKPGNNLLHYVSFFGVVASILFCLFVNPVVGIALVIAMVAFAIITYYRYKAKVEAYFICITQVVRMLETAKSIAELNLPELSKYNAKFKEQYDAFSNLTKNSWLLQSKKANGSLADMVLDYIRMLTHIDLIKFNNMIKVLNRHNMDTYQLLENLGFIETTIAIASFRKMLPYWSVPQFRKDHRPGLQVRDIYHPLIKEPVANSIQTNRHVLLTGSNASGKSTFLKTIALNALLSQTIYTSISHEYVAPFYRIYSSMSLRDDLENSDSYYIVEIKSLKRILDAVNQSEIPVLCFIDEVLRGTNTVERIAASSEILRSLYGKNVLCFAATHDIELTQILEHNYENYHFQEEVTNNDVKFNFKLFKGPATTRNAIKLLNIIGYERKIIDSADRQAAYFLEHGAWKI